MSIRSSTVVTGRPLLSLGGASDGGADPVALGDGVTDSARGHAVADGRERLVEVSAASELVDAGPGLVPDEQPGLEGDVRAAEHGAERHRLDRVVGYDEPGRHMHRA